MTEQKVQGPASYFPSIEKKYGRPVEEWQAIVRAAPGYGAGAGQVVRGGFEAQA